MMKNFMVLSLTACLTVQLAAAQTASYTGIKKMYLSNTEAITENGQIVGYYVFHFLDKASKSESIYLLSLLNSNLQQTHQVEMKMPKNSKLLESSYNGDRFCFSFLSVKEKSITYKLLDKEGKVAGSYVVSGLSNSEMQYIVTAIQSEDFAYTGGLSAVPGHGFVRYGWEKEKGLRISLEMFDNAGKKKWIADSGVPKATKSFETCYPFYADDKYVVSMLNVKPKLLSREFVTSVVIHSATGGRELFRVEGRNAQHVLLPVGVTFDAATGHFFLYGEYFKREDNPMKDRSQGFYITETDTQGKTVRESLASWQKEIGSKVPVNEKGKLEDNTLVAIHKIVRTGDGKVFAIGEQFKQVASGIGIAAAVMSGGDSKVAVTQMQIRNMMIFQFNADLKIEEVHIIEKDKSVVTLPQGYSMLSSSMIAYIMKQHGVFGYAFTTVSPDNKTFNAAYLNYDREKKETNKYIIGNISYTKEQKLATDKVTIDNKATMFKALPSKPGYVGVFEYFRKDKKADLRLEKLNL